MRDKSYKIIGWILIVIGLFFNPFVVEWLFSPDGKLDFLWKYLVITTCDIILIITGFLFTKEIIRNNITKKNCPKNKKVKKVLKYVEKHSLILIIVCIIFLECMSRILIATENNIPFLHTNEIVIYPEIYDVINHYDKNYTTVLLLGGSVLTRSYDTLKKTDYEKPIIFYNLARSGHTSLDSLHKYNYLTSNGYNFDYVIFYHAVNEVRTNNVPVLLYKEDYSHYSFYKLVNLVFIEQSFLIQKTSLGYRLYRFYNELQINKKILPTHTPKKEWLKYGSDIKSKESFRKNLLEIINISNKTKAKLIIPEFAFNSPDNYSLNLLRSFSLGYDNMTCKEQRSPTEIWGIPANVIKGILTHNEVINELKSHFIFINTDDISNDIKNFCDIVHFSEKGTDLFAKKLITEIETQ